MENNIIQFQWRAKTIHLDKKECFLEEEDHKDLLKENQSVWQCNCSCHLFFILPDKMICSNCGKEPVI